MPAASASRELRRGIVLRLALALAALLVVMLGWYAFEPSDHGPASEAPVVRSDATVVSGQVKTEPRTPPIRDVDMNARSAPATDRPSFPVVVKQAKTQSVVEGPSEGMMRMLASGAPQRTAAAQPPVVAEPVSESRPPTKQKLPAGPYLQVGVFSHPANAAELKTKLEADGIPVVIATRVQVGPFKSKKEAEEMRAKLKAMGMESLLINQ